MNTQYAQPLPNDLIAVWIQVFERQKPFTHHALAQLDADTRRTSLCP